MTEGIVHDVVQVEIAALEIERDQWSKKLVDVLSGIDMELHTPESISRQIIGLEFTIQRLESVREHLIGKLKQEFSICERVCKHNKFVCPNYEIQLKLIGERKVGKTK